MDAPWKTPTQEDIWQGAARIRMAFEQLDASGGGTPFFIGRNGTIEIETLYFYLTQRCGSGEHPKYPMRIKEQIQRNAGVFPSSSSSIDRWARSYLDSLAVLDGTAAGWYRPLWNVEHTILNRYAPATCFRTPLRSLEPYYQPPEFRWTQHLAGKHVAVVSSFAETIRKQVWGEKTARIWTGEQEGLLTAPGVKWDFIRTYYAPTTALGHCAWPPSIKTWEDAVIWTVDQVVRTGAQVAIIGCGALGMIIGGQLRARGISVIVMGGAVQVLFGIRGKRWATHDIISKFWNDAWVWPTADEIPGGANLVEGGCYWGSA